MATHTKFAHSVCVNEFKGSLNKFVVPKPQKLVTETVVHPTMVSYHTVSWNSNLDVVPFIFPVLPKKQAPEPKQDGRKFNKGSVDRKPYSAVFKANAIEQYLEMKEADPNYSQDAFALAKGISQGQISKWLKTKDKIFKQAADSTKNHLFKSRPSTPTFQKIEAGLLDEFKKQRNEGRRVSARWFKKTAKKIAAEKTVGNFKISKGWFYLFLRRHKCRSENKVMPKRFLPFTI